MLALQIHCFCLFLHALFGVGASQLSLSVHFLELVKTAGFQQCNPLNYSSGILVEIDKLLEWYTIRFIEPKRNSKFTIQISIFNM